MKNSSLSDNNKINSTPRKLIWISGANVFACLNVVMLHANSVFWHFSRGFTWISANFIETFCYKAVPVFFMISGATLIDYRERYSTAQFFKKRFTRTFIPFLIWSIIGAVWYNLRHADSIESIRTVISKIFNDKYTYVYWFFIPLFAIYLSIPLLSYVKKEKRAQIFFWTAAGAFVFHSVLPLVFRALKIEYNTNFKLPVAGGYLIYTLLGYAVKNIDIKKKYRILAYAFSVAGWFTQFYGTYRMSYAAGTLDQTFKGYLNFPAVLQAFGVFVFFKYFPWERVFHAKGSKLLVSLSKYTFGIYLMHIYLVSGLPKIFHIDISSLFWRIGGSLAIFTVCAVISFIISKTPVVKKIIGL